MAALEVKDRFHTKRKRWGSPLPARSVLHVAGFARTPSGYDIELAVRRFWIRLFRLLGYRRSARIVARVCAGSFPPSPWAGAMNHLWRNRSDIKQREEEARHARLEDRARLVEESRRSYEERVRREEDEIAAREQEVGFASGCRCGARARDGTRERVESGFKRRPTAPSIAAAADGVFAEATLLSSRMEVNELLYNSKRFAVVLLWVVKFHCQVARMEQKELSLIQQLKSTQVGTVDLF